MNWSLPVDSSPQSIVDFVQEHGIAVIDGFISDDAILANTRKEALAESLKAKDGYNFGKAMRYGPTVPDRLTAINKILTDPRTLKIEQLSGKTRQEVFITHEYKHGMEERNGFLHFDRTHTFKLFFYLMDVDADCGPFRAIIDTHNMCRDMREKEWQRTRNYANIKNRPAIDYPELGYTEDDGIPVLGQAGTLIVFDTDTLHKGGLVQPGKQRLILRTHCR